MVAGIGRDQSQPRRGPNAYYASLERQNLALTSPSGQGGGPGAHASGPPQPRQRDKPATRSAGGLATIMRISVTPGPAAPRSLGACRWISRRTRRCVRSRRCHVIKHLG